MPVPSSPWDRLFTDIRVNLPSVVDAVLRQELWRAVEDFLYETNAWVEEIPFQVDPTSKSYTVTPTSNSVIERLLMVFDPASAAYDKRWVQSGIRFAPPNKIELMHAPSTSTTWMAAVSKNINDPASPEGYPVFDDDAVWIVDRYRDAFRYATMGYLLNQPAKPYSNPKLGAINWQSYVDLRGKARAEILHANVYGGQRWMYPQGYATTARKGWA